MSDHIQRAAERVADLFQALTDPPLSASKSRILVGILVPELTAIDATARREMLEAVIQSAEQEPEAPEPTGELDLQPTTANGEAPALKVSTTEDGGLSFNV